ncbi:putative Acylaminoacyl-peptidase [metagenome]|uniref:Putative Acylaminoacyl-peptidase n=1 Tax=metagenome TaxID=256318 RepID=A0A2P2C142_9ZZZZ
MESRFEIPYLLSVRPAPGPSGRALLVENHPEVALGRVWDGVSQAGVGELLPFPVGLGAALMPEGDWVVELDDDGGSEVGHLRARSVDGRDSLDLTPELPSYVVRGLEPSADGSVLVATVVDDDGFHVLAIPTRPWGRATRVYSSPSEAWYAHVSADGTLVSVDTTSHNPHVRRPAVTVVEVDTGRPVAVLNDLPDGPVRAIRFSPEVGDPRVLVSTERSGFARPALWNPRSGVRQDFDLAELSGEVMPLDWHAASGSVLAVHVDGGIHRLLRLHEETGAADEISAGLGSYADPDVADIYAFISQSYFNPDGSVAVVSSRWDTPRHVTRLEQGGDLSVVIPPAAVPPGRSFSSQLVTSRDGTLVQLWWARPAGTSRGTLLEVHGGPNLVTVDGYSPSAQAWLDAGFSYASLNYRGSVTFGRDFREGFWGAGGDRELEDIEAAVAWLQDQGLASPATTFITGPSYGGHLTLLSLGRLPHLFAGGLAHVAMADWKAAWADMNPALRGAWTAFLGGTPEEVPEILERYSAVNFVSEVTASVWLNQGARDTRTPAAQAQRYADALAAAGGDVVIDWFDAGHEPTGLRGAAADQERMLELVERTLAGQAWSNR